MTQINADQDRELAFIRAIRGFLRRSGLLTMSEKNKPYKDLKQDIDRRYSPGRFVAIESNRVVADDESHRQLVEKLKSLGKSPNGVLIVQAGVDYPESAVILWR